MSSKPAAYSPVMSALVKIAKTAGIRRFSLRLDPPDLRLL
jgi:hypothetical protein